MMNTWKKRIAALLAAVMVLSMAACAKQETKATETTAEPTTEETTEPAFDAAPVIANFTTTPEKVSAAFTQTYVLEVQNENYQSFAKDVDDKLTVSVDFTAGDVYYYGKLESKDGTVSEQLVRCEDGVYYSMTTTEEKTALADEAAAVAAIGEMMKQLSLKTAGYIDPGFFTYNDNTWMTGYILLGSTNVAPDDSWFTYTYADNNGGVKADITADYVGYFGDSGTFEFGKQKDADHAAVISLETDAKGYITSFNEQLTSYQELAIISPPVPLVLTGERTMTAAYGEDIARIDTIVQSLPAAETEEVTEATEETTEAAAEEPGTITMGEVSGCTVVTYDFDYASFAFVEGTQVTPGHFVAFQVDAPEGAEITATVNGEAATFINGYYCYMTAAQAGQEYVVSVTAK